MRKLLKLNRKCRICKHNLYYSFFSGSVWCNECEEKKEVKLSSFEKYNIKLIQDNRCVCCHRIIANKGLRVQKYCSTCRYYLLEFEQMNSRNTRYLVKKIVSKFNLDSDKVKKVIGVE